MTKDLDLDIERSLDSDIRYNKTHLIKLFEGKSFKEGVF